MCPQKHTFFSHFMLTFRTRCPDTSWQETMKIDESWSISRGSYKYRCLPDPPSRRENWERFFSWPFNSVGLPVYPKLTSLGQAKKVILLFLLLRGHQVVQVVIENIPRHRKRGQSNGEDDVVGARSRKFEDLRIRFGATLYIKENTFPKKKLEKSTTHPLS